MQCVIDAYICACDDLFMHMVVQIVHNCSEPFAHWHRLTQFDVPANNNLLTIKFLYVNYVYVPRKGNQCNYPFRLITERFQNKAYYFSIRQGPKTESK